MFPFTVPADLSAATNDELSALLSAIREHASSLASGTITQETVDALTECRNLAHSVTETMSARNVAASLAAEVDASTTVAPVVAEDPAHIVEDEVEAAAVTAAATSRNPMIRDLARTNAGTPDLPKDAAPALMSLHAATEIAGHFTTGQRLDSFGDAVTAVADQLDRYIADRSAGRRTPGGSSMSAETIGTGGTLGMTRYTRHSAVQIRRHFPDELRADAGRDGFKIARHAGNERRLPGGSLLSSFKRQIESGRPLTAAAGWCAPSEIIYDLCSLDSQDGLLELPEMQATRGGFQIPANGGPDFATIYNALGNSGDTHLTEAEVIAEYQKYCYDIPCPSFTDVRLGVDYVCLTGSMLQRRGYPEAVEWFSQRALNALPHKINATLIATIVAASGAATVVPSDPSGDDAISGLLSAVDLAIADAKYRNRMSFGGTLEVVLPMWVLTQLRAAGSRRNGVDMVGITDQQIVDWFAIRSAIPRFVYDWQDAFSGLPTGPGGAVPLTALPLTAQFLIYPAGTWVKAVQSVVNLDTVYDSTKLATNEYTAIFVEDGWAALQMCPMSRLYTAAVDPSGVIGCCPLS